ncbi:MAG: acyl-CoA dehydrogenase [Pseudomonadota bacterium]
MDFNHTEERQMLSDMAERFVRENLTIEQRHEAAASDDGFSRERYEQMAELGLIGALFPEDAGGFGGSGFDIIVVFEAVGKGLLTEPFLPSLLAGTALARAGRNDDVEAIAAGGLYAFAYGEPASRYTLEHVGTTATKSGDGYTLDGNKAVVLGAATADHLVVSARTSGGTTDADGISLFLVDAKAEGVHIRGYSTVDGYPAAEIALKDVSAELIGDEGKGIETIRAVTATGALAVCAEALGAVEVCIDMTMDYLKTRTQFGRPIGMFQALQHRMVDMMGEREQIRSAVINAAGHLDGEQRDWHVSAAKNLVGRAGRHIAEEAIQMHGGIAMTWEYAVAHYAKRVVMIDHLFGDTDHHLEQIIKLGRAA